MHFGYKPSLRPPFSGAVPAINIDLLQHDMTAFRALLLAAVALCLAASARKHPPSPACGALQPAHFAPSATHLICAFDVRPAPTHVGRRLGVG